MKRLSDMTQADWERADTERSARFSAGDDGYVSSTDVPETFREYMDRMRRERDDDERE